MEWAPNSAFLFASSSLLLATGVVLASVSRKGQLTQLNLLVWTIELDRPIDLDSPRLLRWSGIAALAASLLTFALAVHQYRYFETWPERYSQLKTAELRASNIDDIIEIRHEEALIYRACHPGIDVSPCITTTEWLDVTKYFKEGETRFEVLVRNHKYGGCGATVQFRLNGVSNPQYSYELAKEDAQLPNVICFLKNVEFLLQ